jgi:hypothetical protein
MVHIQGGVFLNLAFLAVLLLPVDRLTNKVCEFSFYFGSAQPEKIRLEMLFPSCETKLAVSTLCVIELASFLYLVFCFFLSAPVRVIVFFCIFFRAG